MYIVPHLHRCPKCKYEFNWSAHHDYVGLGHPYCPSCYSTFLSKMVPMGKPVDEKAVSPRDEFYAAQENTE